MASSLVELIINRLVKDDEITDGVGANRLLKYWPPALDKWSTKGVRNAFYSLPALPRLLRADSVKRTIADGVTQSLIGYARENSAGGITLEKFGESMAEGEVEIADDVFILKANDARRLLEPPKLSRLKVAPEYVTIKTGEKATFTATGIDQYNLPFESGPVTWSATGGEISERGEFTAGEDPGAFVVTAKANGIDSSVQVRVAKESEPEPGPGATPSGKSVIRWSGTVPPQKWMNFYTKVVSKHAANPDLRLTVSFGVSVDEAESSAREQEARAALRELGLDDSGSIG